MSSAIELPKEYSVLIVDDNEADRYLLRRLLRRGGLGNHYFEAENGEDALAFFQSPPAEAREHPERFPPFLLFLDINMPRMNGFQFLDAFAEQKASGRTVIIVMVSSSTRADDVKRVEGFDFVRGFIEKFPSTAEELREQVTQALAAG